MQTNAKWKVGIPWAMASARAMLAPLMMLGAACRWNGMTMAGMVLAALLSDIFDGVLARRWGNDTADLRLFDSMADTLFYLCVAGSLAIAQSGIWRNHAPLLIAVLTLEGCRFAQDFVKFGKPASYHSYLAKTWGLVLAAAVIMTFVKGHAGWWMTAALLLGVMCLLEGITMSLILPMWSRDVKMLGVALRMRREHGAGATPGRMFRRGRVRRGAVIAAGVALVAAVPARAVEAVSVEYRGGTLQNVSPTAGGTIDETSETALLLRFPTAGNTATNDVSIPFQDIRDFHYSTTVAHHLGVLATIAVGLIAARQHTHTISINYGADGSSGNILQIDLSRRDAGVLLEVLRVRARQVCGSNTSGCGEVR